MQVEIVCMRVSDVSKEPGVDSRGIHFVKCLFVLFDIDTTFERKKIILIPKTEHPFNGHMKRTV